MFLRVDRVYTEVHCIVITHFNDPLFYMAFKEAINNENNA